MKTRRKSLIWPPPDTEHFVGRADWLPLLAAAGLVMLVLLFYAPAIGDGFIWDDDSHVTQNPQLRSLAGLERIWFDPYATPQYYPLAHTVFWVEYHLWRLWAPGYHLVNVMLHAASAVFLWRILRRLAMPGSYLVSVLWAVHPLNVESVAWVTELKNVLSTFWYLLALTAYLRFWAIEQPASSPGRWRDYVLATACFVFALLSKTVACTLPAAVLLLHYWKQGRIARKSFMWMIPWFALGLASGLLTVVLERTHVMAVAPEWAFTPADRVLIAGRALWFYAAKLLWPVHLAFIYPRWTIDTGVWWQWLFPLAAVAVLVGLWLMRGRWGRGPLCAVLFFCGTLFPALGFFNVYPMRYAFVADHFQYLAGVGLLALVVAAGWALTRRLHVGTRLAAGLGVALCLALALTTANPRPRQMLQQLINVQSRH